MGLSSFNRMRARKAAEEAARLKAEQASLEDSKVEEVEVEQTPASEPQVEPIEEVVETKPSKKKTDAEKLKVNKE